MSEIDVFVGRKIRSLRTGLGMSQTDLAEAIGVRFQQIQKYESGMNRVSAARLWAIAKALRAPIEEFFQGSVEQEAIQDQPGLTSGSDARTLRLVRGFRKLPATQQRAVLSIVQSMAEADSAPNRDPA